MLINHRGVTFQGLNMDIGHLRHVRWVKDDDPKSQINDKPELKQNNKSAAQNRWIAYNRMRGQYASAMEHAAPEAFWVDKTKCSHTDENGRIQNPTLNPCAEAISAVKAIAIAQSEGQKIYTINKQNAQTALQKLPIGGEVGSEIRNAVNAGKEVTVHEKSINKHGWKGFGYIVIDPETGAGAYIIEGKGSGGYLLGVLNGFGFVALTTAWVFGIVGVLPFILALLVAASAIATAIALYTMEDGSQAVACYNTGLTEGGVLYGTLYKLLSTRIGNNGMKPKLIETIISILGGTAYASYKPTGEDRHNCF